MGCISKDFSLLIVVILAASSLIMAESANALTITKPATPEFTAKYVDLSYYTQPTYGYDQYTGKTVITKPSEHVDNRTIEIKINNQPFTPFTDQSGNNINLLYNVQYKGSFGQEWSSMFGERSKWANSGTIDPYGTYGYPTQDSSSQYTTISYSIPWNMVEGQMDIQVKALEGYTTRAPDPAREHILWTVYIYTFYGEQSGWSNTQTVTLGGSNSTFMPTPSSSNSPTAITSTPKTTNSTGSVSTFTPTPTSSSNLTTAMTSTNSTGNSISVPLNTLIAVVAVFLIIIVVLSLLLFRRHRKAFSQNKPNEVKTTSISFKLQLGL